MTRCSMLNKQSLFISFCLVIFMACRQNSNSDKTVFRYNEQSGIATLDPAFAKNQSIIWGVHQIYNTLIETDSAMHLVPSLALRWEADGAGIVYTFHLRNDVFFHDNEAFANGKGRKMVAADVVFSLKRITDPATASSGAWIFNNRIDTVEAFKAVDDSTFQLKLARPFNPILNILSMQYCSLVPHEVVEKYGKDFRRHPCGTGPFMFKDWEEGLALTMVKNPTYFQTDAAGKQLPYLDALKISFLDSKAAEFLNFRQGKLDFINDIDPSFKDEILTKKGELKKDWIGKVQLQKHAYLTTEYLGILFDSTNELVKNSPLRMRKVRQAINYAIDKQKMMLYLRNSIGFAATSGFSPQGLPSFTTEVKGYDYQPQKAKQLLAEAGFANGKNMPQIKLLTVPIYADLGSYIASQLGEAGIPVQVEAIQKSLLLEQTSKSQALFFRGSWQADYPDAENFFTVFYSKNPAPPNYTRFKNAAFDVLYEKGLTENNDSLRYKMYNEMDRLIIADAPVVPLWYDMVIHLIQPDVSGFDANALNLLELRWAKKS
ncbi:MAG: ABC transporter substrate-binding protein [Chitinophagaceae bacterium]